MKKLKNEYIEILIKMSWPILMNYIVMTLFEIMDKAIVGNYSTEGFAAIGVSASFIFVITGAFGVLSSAYNIIAAKAVGEKDKETFNKIFSIVMVISIIIGILVIAADLQIAKKLIKLYIPLLAQDIVEGTIFTIILSSIVARIGVYQMAAYNLSETVIGAVGLPMFALSSSAVTLSLQKSSANEKREAVRIINTAAVISIMLVLSAGTIVMIFPGRIMSLITKDGSVIEIAGKILILGIIGQVFNTFNVVYKSYLQGVNGECFVFKCTSIVSFLSIFWIIILAKNFSLMGVYLGIIINNVIFTSIYYFKIKGKRISPRIIKI